MPDQEGKLKYEEFIKVVQVLRAAFPTSAPTKETAAVYYQYLKDLPIPLVTRAVDAIITGRKFASFPTIAEIREAAFGLGAKDMERKALDAWGRANTMLITGWDECKDDVLNEAVRLAFGGWRGFGDSENGNVFDQKRFVECYKISAEVIVTPDRLLEELKKTRAYLAEHDPKKEEVP
jgi:hypothetical protein